MAQAEPRSLYLIILADLGAGRQSISLLNLSIRKLVINHWTEHRDPNGGVRGRTEGVEGPYLASVGGEALGPVKV